jgi:ABC-type sugar transport system permease subunit
MKAASVRKGGYDRSQVTRSPRHLEERFTIVLFLLPALVLFLVFVIYPILQSVYYSLFNWKGLGPAVEFVALDNYRRILTDRVFLIALKTGSRRPAF